MKQERKRDTGNSRVVTQPVYARSYLEEERAELLLAIQNELNPRNCPIVSRPGREAWLELLASGMEAETGSIH